MMWNTTADKDGDCAIFEHGTNKLIGVAATVLQALDIVIEHNACYSVMHRSFDIGNAQGKLRAFHEKADQPSPVVPTVPDTDVQELRLKLHLEEAVDELRLAFDARDLVEIADAIGDALYVVLGTAVACGIEIAPAFDAIHESNMTKFIDGHRREDGKWIKGPSYKPVDLKPIIEEQLSAG